jgi:hypothetical protein
MLFALHVERGLVFEARSIDVFRRERRVDMLRMVEYHNFERQPARRGDPAHLVHYLCVRAGRDADPHIGLHTCLYTRSGRARLECLLSGQRRNKQRRDGETVRLHDASRRIVRKPMCPAGKSASCCSRDAARYRTQ